MIPKPMIYVEPKVRGISEQKKLFKKIKFISIEQIEEFLNGTMNLSENPMKNYGTYIQQSMANVRCEEDTVPYRVGTFYFSRITDYM